MKKICFSILLLSFWLLLKVSPAYSQDYEQVRQKLVQRQQDTRSEIEEIDEQIQRYEERLKLAERKYEALFSDYKNLQRQIALHDEKLSKLQEEHSFLEEEIEVTTNSLNEKRDELARLIESYKKTLSYLYKHGRTSQLALIFSSSSVNQMLVRAFYLEKFNAYRESQAEEIRKAEQELEQTKNQLEKARIKNEELLAEIRQEKESLAKKKEQQERNVSLLRQNKEQIQQELREFQQQREELNQVLVTINQDIEAEEERIRRLEEERRKKLAKAKLIEDDFQRAREVAKYSQPIEKEEHLSSETLEAITRSFAQSKGNLPWPVQSHTISEHFGRRRHPVYGTVTPNLGVEIVADPRTPVHVVHDGYVIYIRPIRGYGDVVVVKHGKYMTAYGNLSEIRVRKNQPLQQGDVIGLSGDQYSAMGESLFFLIRENNVNLDPEEWLKPETLSSKY